MDITEVRIKLMEESEDRLRAFCSITFDNCFVVRDLKIIEGSHGPFVAMPSRKLTNRCARCGNKNHIRSNYCNNCGSKVRSQRGQREEDTTNKLYADVAHPINQSCRDLIQCHVVEEYRLELQRAKLEGYVSRYDDSYENSEVPESPQPQRKSPAGESPAQEGTGSVPPPHMTTNLRSADSPSAPRSKE
ncbi:SpoVG family protein [Aureliella helgolandensis]|uniref:Septation protein SpoVG n=1 Tax=Aureliella helgolandensis TaxID=2527968 RepID=A0A518G8B0_9BACT|nr:SpoVG family protein [Aureliella helgolandensis]QDV24821.1 Putative septation protein SpoVG [Aureliella helgolandensis]